MEMFNPVPCFTPPSCSHVRRITPPHLPANPLSRPPVYSCLPTHQPRLSSLQPQTNPLLSNSMEPFSSRGHSPTTPVISSSHTDGRSLSPGIDEANFHQSLFNPPFSVNIPPNTDRRSLSVITSANTAAYPGSIINIFKCPVCAPPAYVNTASPQNPPRDAPSQTPNGYLSNLLSSAPNGHSVSDSNSFLNTWISTMFCWRRHLPNHVTMTSGSPVPFTMQHMCSIQWQ